MPTTMQMMRLAGNSEFRAAVQRVTEEMKNAGVDLKSKVGVLSVAPPMPTTNSFVGGDGGDYGHTEGELWSRQ